MRVSQRTSYVLAGVEDSSISGLVVEYIVAIDVTRVRFPADALIFVPVVYTSKPPVLKSSNAGI